MPSENKIYILSKERTGGNWLVKASVETPDGRSSGDPVWLEFAGAADASDQTLAQHFADWYGLGGDWELSETE